MAVIRGRLCAICVDVLPKIATLCMHTGIKFTKDVLIYSVDPKGHVYCPYCYRKFVNRYNLKVHIRDKHDNNPINLDCIVCGKTMRNRSCLRVHLYHHRKQQLQADQGDTPVE